MSFTAFLHVIILLLPRYLKFTTQPSALCSTFNFLFVKLCSVLVWPTKATAESAQKSLKKLVGLLKAFRITPATVN
jgi:hypothetical protein